MTEARWVRIGLRAITWVILGFLYLPLVIIVINAFNESAFMEWPPTGFSLRWFEQAITNSTIVQAFVTSIVVALGAVAIALVLGTLAAMAVQRYAFFGRTSISFLLVLPIALPGVITGIALSSTFQTIGIEFGILTIITGHATFCIVLAYNNVIARLRRLPRTPEEASADLGADTWITFRRITMPGMRTALLSGALLAFALSFDEVIVTVFVAGAGTETIPLFVLASMQRPTALPVVNVVAFVLILISVIPVYIAQRISGAEAAGARI
jgi:putative spermidine/putrescine transport system permease protein